MVKVKEIQKHTIKRLPAFTLFESVVAISIITVLIGLGTMIYGNLMNAEKPLSYYQAKSEIDVRLVELKLSQDFENQSFEYENYSIDQKVAYHKGNKNLYQVTYTVFTGSKALVKENHLIPFYNE